MFGFMQVPFERKTTLIRGRGEAMHTDPAAIDYKTHILIGVMTVIADWSHVPKQAEVQKEIDGARDGYATFVLCTPTSIIPAGGHWDATGDRSFGDPTGAGEQFGLGGYSPDEMGLGDPGPPLLSRLAAAADAFASPGARERCLTNQAPPRLGIGAGLGFGLLVHVLCHGRGQEHGSVPTIDMGSEGRFSKTIGGKRRVLNEYHVKFLHHLGRGGVTFLVIGGQARRLHCASYQTRDLDVWVRLREEDKPALEWAIGLPPASTALLRKRISPSLPAVFDGLGHAGMCPRWRRWTQVARGGLGRSGLKL